MKKKNESYPGLYEVWRRAENRATWIDMIKYLAFIFGGTAFFGLLVKLLHWK